MFYYRERVVTLYHRLQQKPQYYKPVSDHILHYLVNFSTFISYFANKYKKDNQNG